MKKQLLFVVSVFSISSSVASGFSFLAETESGKRLYAEEPKKTESGFVKMKTMTLYKSPEMSVSTNKINIYSEKDESLYDCKNKRVALLSTNSYTCKRGDCAPTDAFTYSGEDIEWSSVKMHESIGKLFFMRACG